VRNFLGVTNREGLAIAAKALAGNPYDGHSLTITVEQLVAITGIEPGRIYADKGYHGHDYSRKERVFLSGQRRGLTATILS
jgi:transposase, IS5 family